MDKYIDAEVLKNNMHKCAWPHDMKSVEKFVDMLPAADVVEVVRCKDCKHWREYVEDYPTCAVNREIDGSEKRTKSMDFCSYGERKDD